MTEHHRRILKILKRHAPGLEAEQVRAARHLVMDFTYRDQTTRVTLSLTPRNVEHAVRNVCTDVCKALNLPKITH